MNSIFSKVPEGLTYGGPWYTSKLDWDRLPPFNLKILNTFLNRPQEPEQERNLRNDCDRSTDFLGSRWITVAGTTIKLPEETRRYKQLAGGKKQAFGLSLSGALAPSPLFGESHGISYSSLIEGQDLQGIESSVGLALLLTLLYTLTKALLSWRYAGRGWPGNGVWHAGPCVAQLGVLGSGLSQHDSNSDSPRHSAPPSKNAVEKSHETSNAKFKQPIPCGLQAPPPPLLSTQHPNSFDSPPVPVVDHIRNCPSKCLQGPVTICNNKNLYDSEIIALPTITPCDNVPSKPNHKRARKPSNHNTKSEVELQRKSDDEQTASFRSDNMADTRLGAHKKRTIHVEHLELIDEPCKRKMRATSDGPDAPTSSRRTEEQTKTFDKLLRCLPIDDREKQDHGPQSWWEEVDSFWMNAVNEPGYDPRVRPGEHPPTPLIHNYYYRYNSHMAKISSVHDNAKTGPAGHATTASVKNARRKSLLVHWNFPQRYAVYVPPQKRVEGAIVYNTPFGYPSAARQPVDADACGTKASPAIQKGDQNSFQDLYGSRSFDFKAVYLDEKNMWWGGMPAADALGDEALMVNRGKLDTKRLAPQAQIWDR